MVHADIAYDFEHTGNTHIMVINNSLYLSNISVTLIPPLIIPLSGLQVYQCPKLLANEPTEEQYYVYFVQADIIFTFQFEVFIYYFPTSIQNTSELKWHMGKYLMLTPITDKYGTY